jgi:seryl-tRNA synthetase
VGEQLETVLLEVPNLPHPSAPLGDSEEDAEVLRHVGEKPAFDFEPRDHLALAGGWIDMDRGVRTSGSRFAYLLGDVARLWLGIQRFAIDRLAERGFTLVLPPVMVREEAMYGTGFFPTDRQSIYGLSDDDLFLVGTSEVPLAAFHQKEILAEDDLPLRYCGLSACFRREAGAAGRDTRGIFRTHQFEKVEMFSFCHPDRSWEEHEAMLQIEEEIAQALGLHYRVVNIAAGDLGASAAKKYDIEVWLPGQDRYRELTSCSNCTDYQARRLQARYRPAEGPPRVVHTLNGTAVTSSRTVIAVLETHQQADGSVEVPESLRAYGAPAVITAR